MSFKKILVSSIAAAAVSTSVFAGTATLSATSKGDYLVYPAYYATTDGWQTNIRVVNTNTTNAVVAKVVVREYATSKELLDFPIYLTPGDVWTGDLINQGGVASVNVQSADDSSPEVPMNQPLFNNNPLVGTSYGYVEVLAVAQKPAVDIDAEWTELTPLSKTLLKADYAAVTAADHNGWVAAEGQLFGQQVVTAATAGAEKSMTLMATAYRVTPTVGEDALRNISTGSIFATDTLAASVFGFADVDAQIRDGIAKTRVHAINYTSTGAETQILLTQTTKHTNPDAEQPTTVPYYDTTATEEALNGSVAKFYYVGRTWDESEHTYTEPGSIYSGTTSINSAEQCVTEVCYIYYSDLTDAVGPVNTTYASGWVDLTLGTTETGQGNVAVPTISTIMTGVKVNGVGIVNMLPSAYESAN